MQSTRDRLRANPEVPDELVDDLVHRAQVLKDEAEASRGVPLEEVERVAEELGIEARYVREALGSLEEDAEAEAEADAAAQREALRDKARRARRMRTFTLALAALLGVSTIGGVGVVGAGAARLDSSAQEVAAAQASVETVLLRQAELSPQLLATTGGDPAAISEQVQALRGAATLDEQLQASRALSDAVTQEIAELPAATSEAQSQQRLSLSHELTGIQNRLRVERTRYEQAVVSWEAAADGLGGAAALGLGLAEPLPR